MKRFYISRKWKIILNLLFVLFVIISCKPSDPFVHIPISSEIELTETERVIEFKEPFIPKKQVNKVCFLFDQKFEEDTLMKPPILDGGVRLNIKTVLIDSKNARYDLNELVERGEDILCYVPDDYSNWLDISKRNISFVKLIVSSNQPIKVLKIEWKTYNAWDMK